MRSKAESQEWMNFPVVSSLDGIVSLPAIRGTEVVIAPVSLLRKPADDAAGQPWPLRQTRMTRPLKPTPCGIPQHRQRPLQMQRHDSKRCSQ